MADRYAVHQARMVLRARHRRALEAQLKVLEKRIAEADRTNEDVATEVGSVASRLKAGRELREVEDTAEGRAIQEALKKEEHLDLLNQAESTKDWTQEESEMFLANTNTQLEEDEEIFTTEESLDAKMGMQGPSYGEGDRYRPRKPRFFNRVRTGFEWTQYNKTHYDTDNPPPKQVLGYKFTIFYPDLLDPRKAPTFKLINDPNNRDLQTIRFDAGAPYEPIAFSIVRRPWDKARRAGFRSTFDRGILKLYFNLKRVTYRR